MKIAVCGPPHSGKSVFRERLKSEIKKIAPHLYPYFITANPDGEGSWYQETYGDNPQRARELKRVAKQGWSPERARMFASWTENSTAPLTLLDLGGIADDLNRQICASATHAILLAKVENDFDPWRQLCIDCDLTIIAELFSEYDAEADRIIDDGACFQAVVHRLERGELSTERPAIRRLAERIARIAGPGEGAS